MRHYAFHLIWQLVTQQWNSMQDSQKIQVKSALLTYGHQVRLGAHLKGLRDMLEEPPHVKAKYVHSIIEVFYQL